MKVAIQLCREQTTEQNWEIQLTDETYQFQPTGDSCGGLFIMALIRWLLKAPDSKVHRANMGPIWGR